MEPIFFRHQRRTSPGQAAREILGRAVLVGLVFGAWEYAMLASWGLYPAHSLLASGSLLLLLGLLYGMTFAAALLALQLVIWWRRRALEKYDFRTTRALILIPALATALVVIDAYGAAQARGRMAGLVSTPSGRTNVLLVTLDTLRADYLGCSGNPEVKTPNLDRLFRRARHYASATCPVPMTTPSHASMLCGTLPVQHGAIENAYRLGPENVTLAERLRLSGYRTAAFVSCYPLNRRFGLDQGFEVYSDRFVPSTAWHESLWGRAIDRLAGSRRIERTAVEVNAAAIPWLRAHSDESFFLWVHYFDPHAPYVPPAPWDHAYDGPLPARIEPPPEGARAVVLRASRPPRERQDDLAWPVNAYKGEVSYLDAQLGRLFTELERLDLARSTLVVVAADHGESLGERGYFFAHGRHLYENELHVPLAVCEPGQPGRLIDGLAQLSDLAPEVMRIIGLEWQLAGAVPPPEPTPAPTPAPPAPAGTEEAGFELPAHWEGSAAPAAELGTATPASGTPPPTPEAELPPADPAAVGPDLTAAGAAAPAVDPAATPAASPAPAPAAPAVRLGDSRYALIENQGIILDPGAVKTRGVRSPGWKLIHPLVAGHPEELYDLARDPAETVNLAGARPEVAATLRAALEDGFAHAAGLGRTGETLLDEETLAAMEALGYVGGR